jgi:RND family efflux transporter MFP subunit
MPAKNGNAIVKTLVVLALLAVAGFVVFRSLRETVQVMPVSRGKAADVVPGSVEVLADKGVQALKIEVPGRVAWCAPLTQGTHFKKDEELLKLDTSALDRAFAETKRTYENAKNEAKIRMERNTDKVAAEKRLSDAERLFNLGRATGEDVKSANRALVTVLIGLDLADLAKKKADADFEVAEQEYKINQEKMRVVAPMDGIIEGVFVSEQALVSAGATVFTFYSNLRIVTAKVSEEDFGKVKVGNPALVRLISFPDHNFDARVSKLVPFADPETRRYTVWLDVKAELDQLMPNSTGEVTITVGEHDNVPLVARRAIFDGNFICVVRGGRIEKRQVELGFKAWNRAEITKGVAPGEFVVVEGDLDRFRDGQNVAVEQAK